MITEEKLYTEEHIMSKNIVQELDNLATDTSQITWIPVEEFTQKNIRECKEIIEKCKVVLLDSRPHVYFIIPKELLK